MLPLLFAMIVFMFLLFGAMAFLVCVALPPIRRFALSTALWWAVWGPCSVALLTLAGVALVADAFISKGTDPQLLHHPRLASVFGWGYLIVGVLVTASLATVAAWFHQFLIHRLTFALFRLYVSVVVAGIGSVFGCCLWWWILSRGLPYGWLWSIFTMVLLICGFGSMAYKNARSLRGDAPQKFNWMTQSEFTGN